MSKKLHKTVIGANVLVLKEHGRSEITTREELEKFPLGSLISYEKNGNYYAKGGFIVKLKKDYFIYITLDFSKKYRVRYCNVIKMWVGDVFTVVDDYLSFAKPKKITNFPVIINGNLVRYEKDSYSVKRFSLSDKYNTMVKWHEMFVKKQANV